MLAWSGKFGVNIIGRFTRAHRDVLIVANEYRPRAASSP